MELKDKWTVIFVSAEERYGLATRINNVLQLTCRGMEQGVAVRICAALNSVEAQRKFDTTYNG